MATSGLWIEPCDWIRRSESVVSVRAKQVRAENQEDGGDKARARWLVEERNVDVEGTLQKVLFYERQAGQDFRGEFQLL